MAILFDLDGTLVDTAEDIIQAINNLCLELNYPIPDPKILQDHTSFGLVKLLEIALQKQINNCKESEVVFLRQRFRQLYHQTNFANSKLFDGISELIAKLKQAKFKIGVVTNKNFEFASKILEQVNLFSLIDCLVTADLVGKAKPAPDPVLLALDKLHALPKDSVFIGDAEQDLIAGKAAGVKTILALFGYIADRQQARNWCADYFVTKPNELWEIIAKLFIKKIV